MQDQQPDLTRDRLAPIKAVFSADYRKLLEEQEKVNRIEVNFQRAEDIYRSHKIQDTYPLEEIGSDEDHTLTMQQKRAGTTWELEVVRTDKQTSKAIVNIYRLLSEIPRPSDTLMSLRKRKPSSRDRLETPQYEQINGERKSPNVDYRVGDLLDLTLKAQNTFLTYLNQKYPPIAARPK